MKTPRQVLDENDLTGKLKCYDSELNERDQFDIIYAMKEYAKQWVDRSVEIADMNIDADKIHSRISALSKEIDAQ